MIRYGNVCVFFFAILACVVELSTGKSTRLRSSRHLVQSFIDKKACWRDMIVPLHYPVVIELPRYQDGR